MMRGDQILLVEGVNDKYFFEAMLRSLQLQADVKIAVPKDRGGTKAYNNKGGIFTTLPLFISSMVDGSIQKFGVIVDADTAASDGMGFAKTLNLFAEKVGEHSFSERRRVGPEGGYVFRSNDGLGEIGLWIMPDNQSEGMLEDWAYATALDSERPAIAHAEQVLLGVPGERRFKDIHRIKAVTSVWMSWQKTPGQGIKQVVSEDLLDQQHELYGRLVAWLKELFN